MDISALIPVYKNDDPLHFEDALKSIINQTHPVKEVVIMVDGDLTPDLGRVLDEFESRYPELISIHKNKVNMGLGKCLRIGIHHCKYELVARMDADDISDPDRVKIQYEYFQKDPSLDIIGSYIAEFEHTPGDTKQIRTVPLTDFEIKKQSARRNPFNHMTVMIKKESVLQSGNYQHMPFFEDYYLWVRMFENNCKSLNISKPLVFARTGNGMYSRRGGFAYFKHEYRFQKELYNRKYINFFVYTTNLGIRFIARIINKKSRSFIYRTLLRRRG